MLWEVFRIFLLDKIVHVLDVRELALGEELHFVRPNDGNTHILSGVSHDGTTQKVWINCH
jgi:hypothetical protein